MLGRSASRLSASARVVASATSRAQTAPRQVLAGSAAWRRWNGGGKGGSSGSSSGQRSSGDTTLVLGTSLAAALAASRWLAPLEAACEGETGAAAVPPLDAGVQEPMPLRATADLYSGLAIDQASLAEDPEAFDKQLEKALAEWKAAGKKAVWVTIPSRLVGLIPVAAARGFEFHNAEAGKGAMMVAWLPGGEHNLPQPCTHYVGVGVAVVDAQGRILVVQEKAGPAAARGKDFWKVPTGLVDAGEDIATAAEREVWEETGIRVRFEGVISFRQQHKAGVQQKTDLFFLCKATPLSTEINACATEIARAEWMPLKHFLSTSPLPEGSAYWFMNRLAAESFLAGKGDIGGVRLTKSPAIFAPSKLPRGFGGSSTNLIFSDAGTPPPSLLAKPTDAPPAPRPRL